MNNFFALLNQAHFLKKPCQLKSPRLVDLFTYLGNNISSTESDIHIGLTKAWTISVISSTI